jgi:hypothetical protein
LGLMHKTRHSIGQMANEPCHENSPRHQGHETPSDDHTLQSRDLAIFFGIFPSHKGSNAGDFLVRKQGIKEWAPPPPKQALVRRPAPLGAPEKKFVTCQLL